MSDPILPPHSTPSTLQLPEFEILGILGSGTFGTVWKVRWHRAGFATPPIVALKRIRMDPCKKYQEAELVKGLDHPNIVKLHHQFYSYNTEDAGHLNLVFEYLGTTSLLDLLDSKAWEKDQAKVLTLFSQLLRGVQYLHRRNLVHRDLKPANVMIREEDGAVKIIDFGHAKFLKSKRGGKQNLSTCYCVSRYYRAPELLLGNINYGEKVDVWALGCILAEMMVGSPVFPGDNTADQFLRIAAILGAPSLQDLKAMAPHRDCNELLPPMAINAIPWQMLVGKQNELIIDLLSHMLCWAPDERWDVRKLLQHRAFHGED